MQQPARVRPRDIGVAGLALAATLAILATRGFGTPDPAARHLDALGVTLATLSAAPLLARHRAPAIGYAISALASLTLLGLGYPLDAPVAAVISAYALAVAASGTPLRHRWPALVAVNAFVPALTAVYLATATTAQVWDAASALLGWAAVFAAGWIVADRNRLRALRLAEARERARRLAADAERERRLAAAHERTRIARELHDSAGHAINVILVQAGAARLLSDRDPPGARKALTTIEEVARDTIDDIDRLVRALRDDQDVPADPGALDDLVRRHRAGGLAIEADLPDRVVPLPRGVAWATYRIIQEALTNAARHGRGTACLAVRFHPDQVEIEVTNPSGPAPAGRSPGGHGIIGMRERACLLGGTLHAGAEGGVFRLHAILPHQGTPHHGALPQAGILPRPLSLPASQSPPEPRVLPRGRAFPPPAALPPGSGRSHQGVPV